jgi:hypothetical protein
MQLWNTALLIADVVKVFNPQSPQARAILDLAIVVIAVTVVIFAIVVGIAREDCGTARQLLVLATAAPHFSGICFLTAVHQKNSNETATKAELNEMKSRIGTRDDSIAATCDQSAAGRREGKASM